MKNIGIHYVGDCCKRRCSNKKYNDCSCQKCKQIDSWYQTNCGFNKIDYNRLGNYY